MDGVKELRQLYHELADIDKQLEKKEQKTKQRLREIRELRNKTFQLYTKTFTLLKQHDYDYIKKAYPHVAL